MKVYLESEVKKLIEAFMEKYKDGGCDGLPYYPQSIDVNFYAIEQGTSMAPGALSIKPSEKYPAKKMEYIPLSEEQQKEFKNIIKE